VAFLQWRAVGRHVPIPIIYVPVLMITHVVAFYLLLRPQPKAVRALAGDAAASLESTRV